MQTSLDALRGFDFTNPDASTLAGVVDSMAQQLKDVEGAVHLPDKTRLNQLGGVGHLRQLERELSQSAQQLRAAHGTEAERTVFSLRASIVTQAGEVQRVADAISGC